jgi:hypothetical protein
VNLLTTTLWDEALASYPLTSLRAVLSQGDFDVPEKSGFSVRSHRPRVAVGNTYHPCFKGSSRRGVARAAELFPD